MRRLAAGRRAGVEDVVTGPNLEQRRRKLGAVSWTETAPVRKPGSAVASIGLASTSP